MAVSTITRNLRDGALVIKDGTGSPQSITITLDEGDLTWTERKNTIEVKDRGALDHTRPGDAESVLLSFSAKWTQLADVATGGATLQLYEFLTFASGAGIVSTSPAGEQDTLTFEFTITDPAGNASEKITFTLVYRETVSLSEGDRYNLISFAGRAFIEAPTVARL